MHEPERHAWQRALILSKQLGLYLVLARVLGGQGGFLAVKMSEERSLIDLLLCA